ncbi:c-type cytochrome [Ramlibacter tataouinensis]|uniref:Candidate Cytochrome c4 n=1 Tax=Ramlibacter tataouinensis (strain ATCC BAA-407 / DSM 14655 / LMG 21543 / TTB310) TaxID=365046 RepID=F5XY76_RAMTT|nr:cytochrome c4 [Ramlibacter tataouinensis]AEG91869.1 Candidate Cytochrome c4 precursor [Ramlibacter tataouinensis TTB310]
MKLHAFLLMAASLAATVTTALAQQPAANAAPADQVAPAQPAAAAQAPAKPDPALGEQRFTAVCAACHGADGNSAIPANPKLAAQHPEYIVKQLQEYKAGKRPNAIMQGFAAQLSDADMRNIAVWLDRQKAKPGFARDKQLVATGERIWRGGLPDRQIAACAGCHSPNGAGIPAQYPRLSGQHADYTAAQLVKFRTAANVPNVKGDSARPNSVQMMQIASRMTDQEIRAVSDYVAGLR